MKELISFQNNLLANVTDKWFRFLFDGLKTEEKLLGLKGLRGVGKTTLLLQYLAYALQNTPNIGSIRETFFLNQLSNAGYNVQLSAHSDFLINNKWTFEIGGKNKKERQIKGISDSFLALDEIEYGFSNHIPLWLFGFLLHIPVI